MPFRNRDNIIKILNPSDSETTNPYLQFEPYFNDKEYWCLCFTNGVDLTAKYIPDDILSEIRHGELNLLLSDNLEGMVENAKHVETFIEHLDIPTNKVVYMTSAYDTKSNINCLVADGFEFVQQHRSSNTSIVRKPKKRFIYPNHRWRPHRPALVALLFNKRLLDKGYVSLRKADDNKTWSSYCDQICQQFPELENLKDSLYNMPELHIDDVDFNVGYPEELDQSYYNDSYFSIVSETNFYDDSRFFSEKTYKNIDYEIPFILVSRPNSLSLLREKGYKTFSPYINEDYDLEIDNNKRLRMIADEVERLCNLTDDELSVLIDHLSPICKYNRQVLINKKYPDDFIWHTL